MHPRDMPEKLHRNHVYRFESKYYVQKEGGAIGLRLTGIIAEISMAAWELKFRDLLVKNSVQLLLSKIYVDDQNLLYRLLRKGTRWDDKGLSFSQEWEREDELKDEPSV